MEVTEKFNPRKVAGSIEHENIKIRCKDYEDPQMTVGVRKNAPLSKNELAVELSVKTNDAQFVVDLDSVQLDTLEGGIHQAQKHLMETRK